jgi:hypothetical protein
MMAKHPYIGSIFFSFAYIQIIAGMWYVLKASHRLKWICTAVITVLFVWGDYRWILSMNQPVPWFLLYIAPHQSVIAWALVLVLVAIGINRQLAVRRLRGNNPVILMEVTRESPLPPPELEKECVALTVSEPSYDTPIYKAILFVAGKIQEPQDQEWFPRSRVYIRQQALDGRLTLWGRKQLDPPGPFKDSRKFSEVLTLIPKEYWAISKMMAGALAVQYAATVPHSGEEQAGSWPRPTNAYSDIQVNWGQLESLPIWEESLPVVRPKIVPAAFAQRAKNDSLMGVFIANDGEPAYDVYIPNVPLGKLTIQIKANFPRLTKQDGSQFCEVCILRPADSTVGGVCLSEEMHKRDRDDVSFAIHYSDGDHRYVSNCKFERDANGIIRVRLVGQELVSTVKGSGDS